LVTNAATYLKDLVFELKDSAVYNAYGTYEVKVTFSGHTAIDFSSIPGTEDIVIDYPQSSATYTVSINAPSTGGGSSYNSIKFVANGGSELKNISVRRGGKVSELPVPVREGYVFTGWYTDSALKTPFDKDTVINKNYTLYAAWVEDSGTVEIVHETPEMLNGEDHFAYVLGYPDGTVRPNANITRAEVTSIFFRLLKDEVREENLTNDNSFNDVNGEDWYNTAVSTMAKLGIVNGRTADEFVPNANITRAEFAAICARFDESQYSIVDKFTDIISHWAEDEIHETAAYGWIKGYEDGTFKPDKAITRAEAMTMINRVLNRVPETADDLLSDMIVWPDNSESDWYYLPVQEATNGHNYEMKNNIYEKWTEITDVTDWTKYE
ncbi:MAG: S-layer homology domain-containing protein, partial [Clostridia bacterium]|nr:S-layer homology domain-containing protein [Clostridia bacterium]